MLFYGNIFNDKAKRTLMPVYETKALALGELFLRIHLFAHEDRVQVPDKVSLFLNEKHIPCMQTDNNRMAIELFLKDPENKLVCIVDALPSSYRARQLSEYMEKFPNVQLSFRQFNADFSLALHCDRYFYFEPERLWGVSGPCVGDAKGTYDNVKRVWLGIEKRVNPVPALEMQPN